MQQEYKLTKHLAKMVNKMMSGKLLKKSPIKYEDGKTYFRYDTIEIGEGTVKDGMFGGERTIPCQIRFMFQKETVAYLEVSGVRLVDTYKGDNAQTITLGELQGLGGFSLYVA